MRGIFQNIGKEEKKSTVTRRGGFRHLGIIESAYLLDDMFVEAIGFDAQFTVFDKDFNVRTI